MNRNNKKIAPVKPFFSRFLEIQDLEKVTGGGKEDIVITLKYPSDAEDVGG